MGRPGRPELYPTKKLIGFDAKLLDAIDEWRQRQKPVPNVSDAIRALVVLGLERSSPARRAEAPKRKKKTRPA
jgi:hypothetical protein